MTWLVRVQAEDFDERAAAVRHSRRAREETGRADEGRSYLPRPD
ncbi:hypothetical protein ACU61A_20495 [Pseudonocardia sichuanensis]